MKMLWLLVSTLVLHQAVAMESAKEPVEAMSEIILAVVGDKANDVECTDGESSCPDGDTCCKTKDGEWACCPLPHAVCCKDREHCCPKGYTCDLSAGTCTRQKSEIIEIFLNKPAIQEPKAKVVPCNATTFCPDGNTCCRLQSGEWGCCPFPNAVCCSDRVHCCPHGYTCTSSGKCQQGSHVTKLFKKKPAIQVKNVICPDGQSECPDGNTCCKLKSGQWGCCPLRNAVCCPDHVHCCPHGYTCTSTRTCQKGSLVTKLFKKKPAIQGKNVICPDGQSECPDGNTCCKLKSGQYGCCPLPNAVCCSDGVHCCPDGYTCDVSAGTCTQHDHITDLFLSKPATEIPKVKIVVCPGGTTYCPDGNTCCKLESGKWGCCPLPNAVCCPDHVHCCPHGYTCTSTGTCQKGSLVIKLFKKKPAIQVKNVVCPDGSECPDGNTCCEMKSGQYGCCPFPNAVCCSDHVHCCPQGYTCDVSAGTCTQHDHFTDLFLSKPATEIPKGKNVVCPGGAVQCPDGNTCCKLESGQWGCCPLPNAVCCSDGVHCCPQGYTCDVSTGTCTLHDHITDLFLSKPATEIPKGKNVICPDGSECPDGNTCCQLKSGGYGCCPFSNAVCCSDHVHCCPQGYTCDVSAGTCTQHDHITDLFLSKPATAIPKGKNVICPDGQSQCPDGNTCCKLKSGEYGCCPLPNAVCCSDGVHCCPEGYTCDVSQGTCTQRGQITAHFLNKPASKVKNLVCPGGQAECPDGTTCCELKSGEYGCCPLPNAVCCSDGVHCCPQGYTCDVSTETCTRHGQITDFLPNKPATQIPKVRNVLCPDGESSCPDGNTCCKLAGGEWGCCPLLKAVCCSDGEHCCPHGYTCDVAKETCTQRGQITVRFLSKPATQISEAEKPLKNK